MDRTRLAAVVDRIMPADRDGGAIAFGALDLPYAACIAPGLRRATPAPRVRDEP